MPTPKPRISDPTLFKQKVAEGFNTKKLSQFFDVTERTIQTYYHKFGVPNRTVVGSYAGFRGTIQEASKHFGVPDHWFNRVKQTLGKEASYDLVFEVTVEKFKNAQKEKETKRAREELNSISSLARTASRGGRHTGHAG